MREKHKIWNDKGIAADHVVYNIYQTILTHSKEGNLIVSGEYIYMHGTHSLNVQVMYIAITQTF